MSTIYLLLMLSAQRILQQNDKKLFRIYISTFDFLFPLNYTFRINCVKLNHELNLILWSHFVPQVTTSEIVFGIKIENVMTSERHSGRRKIYEEKITSLFLVRWPKISSIIKLMSHMYKYKKKDLGWFGSYFWVIEYLFES